MGFIKTCCNTIKDDLVAFVNEFYANAKLSKDIITSFLTLIPKLENPSRLKRVVPSLIFRNQSGFGHKKMLDGVLLINELMDLYKRLRRECFLPKIGFEKECDNVFWNYIRSVMGFLGLGARWMDGSVFSSSFSILVNDSPTKNFDAYRGLMHGDPIFPFLFLLAVEGLISLVKNVILQGELPTSPYKDLAMKLIKNIIQITFFLRISSNGGLP
ncbi:unnamed protein product [Lathyrus sativus]|nr:unnamed protein product [Lathyrus sativus]